MSYLYSNYPDGFNPGVVIRDILGVDVIPGKVFYVGNNATLLKGERGAADSNDGTFFKPFSTIDAAYNKCAANRNDIIFVRPNHSETLADATSLVMDVAGVHIVGLGSGEDRPEILFATATTASIPVTGVNNSISNFVLKCNIASQDQMFDVAADDFKVLNCEMREGTATGLGFIRADTADGDSDRLLVKGCKFHMPTAANGDFAIQLAKDFTGVRIQDCEIYGDFDLAAIEIPAGGNAQVDLIIENCKVTNLLTGVHAIEINGTGNTGKIINCYCQGDTLGTIVDAGGLEMYNVYEHDGTDQQNARLIAKINDELVDDANNPVGVDDSNNAFASTNVVANVDGSVLERLEALMDPLGGYDPVLGFRVTKTSNLADGSGTDNLFTVNGRVLITHLSGEVTTVIGTSTTMKLRDTTNSVDLCAATTITSDAVGTMYALPGLSAEVLNGTGGTPVVGSVPNVTTPSSNAKQIIGGTQAAITVAQVLDAAGTGAVDWVLYYKPLVASATVAAAA